MNRVLIFIIGFIVSLTSSTTFANINAQDELFVSNNSKEITLQTAYQRLNGKEQNALKNQILSVLYKNNITPGKFIDILGAYQMSNDKNFTADNTELCVIPSDTKLEQKTLFSIAKELAIKLNQDSVAVFIPNQSTLGAIDVEFALNQPKIDDLTALIHEKLPSSYSQAFSLRVTNTGNDFSNAKVEEIEWLGSKINLAEVKKAFPNEKITSSFGTVFLIYQNGKTEQL